LSPASSVWAGLGNQRVGLEGSWIRLSGAFIRSLEGFEAGWLSFRRRSRGLESMLGVCSFAASFSIFKPSPRVVDTESPRWDGFTARARRMTIPKGAAEEGRLACPCHRCARTCLLYIPQHIPLTSYTYSLILKSKPQAKGNLAVAILCHPYPILLWWTGRDYNL
jgi:hypothetical protein